MGCLVRLPAGSAPSTVYSIFTIRGVAWYSQSVPGHDGGDAQYGNDAHFVPVVISWRSFVRLFGRIPVLAKRPGVVRVFVEGRFDTFVMGRPGTEEISRR